jgi:hypothetical protein
MRPATAASAATSIVLYIAPAIAGWGGAGPFFAHPARAALVVTTIALMPVALFTQCNLSRGEREDRSNRWCSLRSASSVFSSRISRRGPTARASGLWIHVGGQQEIVRFPIAQRDPPRLGSSEFNNSRQRAIERLAERGRAIETLSQYPEDLGLARQHRHDPRSSASDAEEYLSISGAPRLFIAPEGVPRLHEPCFRNTITRERTMVVAPQQ